MSKKIKRLIICDGESTTILSQQPARLVVHASPKKSGNAYGYGPTDSCRPRAIAALSINQRYSGGPRVLTLVRARERTCILCLCCSRVQQFIPVSLLAYYCSL